METRSTAAQQIPRYAVAEKANEHVQRLRSKKREDVLQSETYNGSFCDTRRHKERTALGTISSQNGAAVPTSKAESQNEARPAVRQKTQPMDTQAMPTELLPASIDLSDILAAQPTTQAVAAPAVLQDPHNIAEYTDDIFTYLHGIEAKFMAKPRYMRKQRDINHGMRAILIDWLVEVSMEYRLDSQTLFMAVSYIDRFLSEMSVQRGKLQLVGVTAMLLAAKYEEIYPPAVDEFVYVTDNTYSKAQILKMEHLILKVLKFDMGGVTAYSFFHRYIKLTNADATVMYLAMYLMELTLQDGERFLKQLPSVIAAAAISVAYYTVGRPHWPVEFNETGVAYTDNVKECIIEIYYCFANAARNPQQAVRDKYSHKRYRSVTNIPHPPLPPTV